MYPLWLGYIYLRPKSTFDFVVCFYEFCNLISYLIVHCLGGAGGTSQCSVGATSRGAYYTPESYVIMVGAPDRGVLVALYTIIT